MPHPKTADLEQLLRLLSEAGVDFVIVGGAAAVIHGAPITTHDLDIVHDRSPENVSRLLDVLESLDAQIRPIRAGAQIRPTADMLSGQGQLNLATKFGPLDPLCQLHDGRGYDELLSKSKTIEDQGLTLRVLDLPTLIEVKAQAGRAKDKLALAALLALQKKLDAD